MEYITLSGKRRYYFNPLNRKWLVVMHISISILSILFMLIFLTKLLSQPVETSGVTLKAKQTEYPQNTAQISLLFMNNSEYTITYYDTYMIECKRNNKWERIEASYKPPSSGRLASKELEPNCELVLYILTSFPHGYLPAGEYRVSLAIDYGQNSRGKISEAYPIYAEFSIVESIIRVQTHPLSVVLHDFTCYLN